MSESVEKNRQPTRQFLKTFLAVFIPLALIVTVFQFVFYRIEVANDRLALKTGEHFHLDNAMSLISGEIRSVLSDLAFLSEMYELREMLEHPGEEYLNEVNQEFLIFSQQKKIYDQVRYLDETGREIARTDFNAGRPVIVPASRL